MNLVEQCFELEDWESLWIQGPTLNFIRAMTKWILDDLDRPSVIRQMFVVEREVNDN
jgi:hypothetical protein